jgi:hypothetical protein
VIVAGFGKKGAVNEEEEGSDDFFAAPLFFCFFELIQ